MSQNTPEPTTTTLVSSTTTTTTLPEATNAVKLVQEQITQYDAKSSQYKTLLRTVTAAISSATTPKDPNTVTIEWVKVTFYCCGWEKGASS